jgi:hypothetical protein
MVKFNTTLLQTGNNTGIDVPAEVVAALGSGKKPAVMVRIGSYSYRSTIAVMGGRNLIAFSADRRKETGLKGGDAIEVELELDTAPRQVLVPDDLAAELAAAPGAKASFDELSYSNQLRHVLSVTEAKTADTRQKRIANVLAALGEHKK